MAHPLLDRRDLTAQRELAGAPAPTASRSEGGRADELYAELCALLRQDRARIEQLCVTDREPAQAAMRDFPTPGVRRLIVRRAGTGGLVTLAAGSPLLLLPGNEARLGGQIVVAGTGAVVLYLGSDLLTPGGGAPLASGAPQIWLAAGGGAWDFRLGNLLWCGSVTAVAAAGSQVTVAEV